MISISASCAPRGSPDVAPCVSLQRSTVPPPSMQSTESSAPVIPHGIYYIDEGDCVARVNVPRVLTGCNSRVRQVENTLFRFHSSHLQRDTTYFDNVIMELTSSSGESPVGSADDNPLVLDAYDVRAQDFGNLLWFFYESAYKWYV